MITIGTRILYTCDISKALFCSGVRFSITKHVVMGVVEGVVNLMKFLEMATAGEDNCSVYAIMKECHDKAYMLISEALDIDESGLGGCSVLITVQ